MEQFQRAAVAGGVELEVQGQTWLGRSARSRLAGTVDSPSRCRLRFCCRTGQTLGVQLCRTLNFNGGTVTAGSVVAAAFFSRPEQEHSKSNSSRAPGPSRALSQSR